jgi:regulator of cell morphogenesis and NO signaling
MTDLLNKPVSQIVNDNFSTAQVFEKYGLDFCCRGKNTLQRACEEKGIVPNEILSELSLHYKTDHDEKNFTDWSSSALVSYIVENHHRYVKENAPSIQGYLNKVVTKHGDHFPFMKEVAEIFERMTTELNIHMEYEEQHLFPMIASNGDRSVISNDIHQMEKEHEAAGDALERIRTLTSNYNAPEQSCVTFKLVLKLLNDFEKNLHQHVHLENNVLFPRFVAK